MRFPINRSRSLLVAPLLVALVHPATMRVDAAPFIAVEVFDDRGELLAEPGEVLGVGGALPGSAFLHAWSALGGDGADGGIAALRQATLETLVVHLPATAAGVHILDALVRNEVLDRVVFHFFRTGETIGLEGEILRVTVGGVRVAGVHGAFESGSLAGSAGPRLDLAVELVYERADLEANVVTERIRFLRGDLNGDLSLDVSDPIRLLLHLFAGGGLECLAAADANADGSADIADAIALLAYLFQHGVPPPAPFPGCGAAPAGLLDCAASACDR